MSKSKQEIIEAIEDAQNDGQISASSKDLIVGNLNNNIITAASGLAVDDVESAEITLITACMDMSSSIEGRMLTDIVIQGQNDMVKALMSTKKKDSIMMAQWLFNGICDVLHSYDQVDNCKLLDKSNYQPNGMTDLYGVSFDAISANVVYAQQLRDGGTPTQSIVVVITDGEDTIGRFPASKVNQIAKDILKTEQFVLAYIGVGDDLNHKQISEEMGFPAFLQVGVTQSEIRKLFKMVSQSVIKTSGTQIDGKSNNAFFDV